MAYINPSFLALHQAQAQVQQPPVWSATGPVTHDLSAYAPGVYHIPIPPPTPAAILSGAYTPAQERIEYCPRRDAFSARPTLSVPFSVRGHPAPYLKDILFDRVRLDGAMEEVMADQGWSRTRWVLDWPGYENHVHALAVPGLTRVALAKLVAAEVKGFLLTFAARPARGDGPWAPHNVHFGDVRIVAMNYYGRVWVPILAFDAL